MRVLIATYFSLPSHGGVATYIHELEQGLTRRGYEVEILAPHATLPRFCLFRNGNYVEKASIEPLVYRKVHDFFHIYFTSYMKNTARQKTASHGALAATPVFESISLVHSLELQRYYLEIAALYFGLQDYDLIHTQDVVSSLALARVKPEHIPLVVTLHGYFEGELRIQGRISENDHLQREYVKLLEQSGISASDVSITPSNWLKSQMLQNYTFMHQQFAVIASGIDLADFQNRLNELPQLIFDFNKINLVCPARLDAVKGHQNLLNALVKLKQERQDWLCWFIGDGPMRRKLERFCQDRDLSLYVKFTGMRNDVPSLLKQADVMVLASRQENLPFAVMEAQLAGKPVVVTNVGGMPEMVSHEQTGLVCDVDDSDSIYLNLKRMLNDEELRHRLGKNSKIFAYAQWSLAAMMHRIDAIYKDALRKKREQMVQINATGTVKTLSRVDSNLSHEKPNQFQDRFRFVLAKPYERLFRDELPPSIIRLDRAVWDRVLQHASATYSLPNDLVLQALFQVMR